MDLFTHRVRQNDGSITTYTIARETGEIVGKLTSAKEVADVAVDAGQTQA